MKTDDLLLHAQELIKQYQVECLNYAPESHLAATTKVPDLKSLVRRIRAGRRKEIIISLTRTLGVLPLILKIISWKRNRNPS